MKKDIKACLRVKVRVRMRVTHSSSLSQTVTQFQLQDSLYKISSVLQGNVYMLIFPGTVINLMVSSCHSSLMECHLIKVVYLQSYISHYIQNCIQTH